MNNMLFSIAIVENELFQENLLKKKDSREQFSAIGQKMEEEDMMVIALKNLPRAYEHFIKTLNISNTNVT